MTIQSTNIKTFETCKKELLESINILDKKIKACTGKTDHNSMIFILDEMNTLYKTKFVPFHTATGKIFGEKTPNAQQEFDTMKGQMIHQCNSIKQLWKTHKQDRSILQTSKSIWQDNAIKENFKYTSSQIEKAVLLSKPLKSYSPSDYHFISGDGFFTGFLLGAILC